MRTFMFLAVGEARTTGRVARAAVRAGATVILDLEDALWDVADVAGSLAIKRAGRAELRTLAASQPELFAGGRIGVRVNRLGGPDEMADLDVLEELAASVPVACVMVPKVEAGHVEHWAAALGARGLRLEIVPIVETSRGLDELPAILTSARAHDIGWVVYGIYDLVLDFGWWPMPDQRGEAFWERVEPFIAAVEDAGLSYVHPPYGKTRDAAGIRWLLARLARTCGRDFGMLTIAIQHVAAAAHASSPHASSPHASASVGALDAVVPPAEPAVDPLAAARSTVQTWQRYRRPGMSFAVDATTGDFVSPHAYLTARRYLEEHAPVG